MVRHVVYRAKLVSSSGMNVVNEKFAQIWQ